jgi:hypothetical protein
MKPKTVHFWIPGPLRSMTGYQVGCHASARHQRVTQIGDDHAIWPFAWVTRT